MVEVGEVAIAGGPGEDGVEQRRLGAHVLVEGADTVASHPLAERRQPPLQLGKSGVARLSQDGIVGAVGEVGRGDAEEPRQPGGPGGPRIGRRGEAAEEQTPVQRRLAVQHGSGARPHRRNAPLTEHVGRLRGPPLRRHEDPDVGGPDPSRLLPRADDRRVEQRRARAMRHR